MNAYDYDQPTQDRLFDAANACIDAVDMTVYEDAYMVLVPGFRGEPQVLVMPAHKPLDAEWVQ